MWCLLTRIQPQLTTFSLYCLMPPLFFASLQENLPFLRMQYIHIHKQHEYKSFDDEKKHGKTKKTVILSVWMGWSVMSSPL